MSEDLKDREDIESEPPPLNLPQRFKKGRAKTGGRKKGQQNHMSVAMRDAVVEAIDWAGFIKWDAKRKMFCKEGDEKVLVAFMKFLVLFERDKMMPLVQRVLPMHVTASVVNRAYRTEDEVRALCAERGIPFASLIDLSVGLEDAPPELIDVTPDDQDPMD
jgi:hypothetical protein